MLRLTIGVLLAIHGFVHVIGFVVPWRIARIEGFAYTTTAAWGRIDLGDVGARTLGIMWLLAAMAFVVAGIGVGLGTAWSLPVTALVTAFSAVLCLAGSPAAIAGLLIDGVILAAILAAMIFP